MHQPNRILLCLGSQGRVSFIFVDSPGMGNRIRSAVCNKSQSARRHFPTAIYFMAIYFIPARARVRRAVRRHTVTHGRKIRALRLTLHSITEPTDFLSPIFFLSLSFSSFFSLLNASQRSHVHSGRGRT